MAAGANALILGALALVGPQLVHGSRVSMGTVFDILAYDESRAHAESTIAHALDEIDRLDSILSDYKSDSELRRAVLAARSTPVRVSPELYEVLSESLRYARLSGGAFDPTVAPLVRAWKSGETPDAGLIERLQPCIGWQKLRLISPDRLQVLSDCLELDLGGIGKGYAIDRAAAILVRFGVTRALINAGSSTLLALETPPGESGWTVELPHRAGSIKLTHSSLSISEQAVGHIIDPASGRPSPSSWAVAVVAPTATASDALSTALLVLGPDRGATVLSQLTNTTVRWIDGAGMIR